MYGNPCGRLGAYTDASRRDAVVFNGAQQLSWAPSSNNANGGVPWWQGPLETITGAVVQQIGGSTPPYSPGTYDPVGYSVPVAEPAPIAAAAPALAAGAPAIGGMNTLLLAGLAIAGLKVAGVF